MSGKSLTFGPADRDAQGRIAAERSLADMLPAAEPAAPLPSAAPGARVKTAQLTALAFVGVAVLIALFALVRPGATPIAAPSAAPTAVQPTNPQQQSAAAPATATATSGCVIVQTTATFYAPAGSPAPIAAERGQTCHLVAWHSAFPGWRQITIGDGAPVWVPLATLNEASTATLPDLAPPPTSTPALPPPATARPVVIVEQAPPEPTRCATVRGGGATVQRCGSAPLADLQADAEAAWREQMQVATAVPTWSDLGTYAEQATDMAIVSSLHDTPTPGR